MKHTSLYRHRIDWEALYASAFKIAEHAQTPADTYDAIRFALNELGDHHSHFRPPEEVVQVKQTTVNDIPLPQGKLLLDKIGFIKIESYNSPDDSDNRKYATIVQHLIRNLDAQGVCGWIVDLRENTGGSTWPMLAGLGPILGEGELGAAVDADGNKSVWAYQDGQILEEESVTTYINGPAYQLKVASPPVAVLTGMKTASAGEAVVIAFRGRANTRSFGLNTAGVSTGNSVFQLSDGAWIAVTTTFSADRTGQIYEGRIDPDERVDAAWELTIIEDEIIPQPAIDWLMSQPACTAQN
jgi:C-terminal processing protease CtpA/Prc